MANAKLKSCVAARLRNCRKSMAEQSLDGLIVVDPLDVSYLTGFAGEDSVLVVTAKRKVLVTDTRFTVQAHQECPGLPLHIRKGQIDEAVALMLQRFFKNKRKPPAVGIEADNITVSQFSAYRKMVGKGLKSINPLVSPLRKLKDNYEITQIRKAIRVAQDAMTQTIGLMKVGMSEIEIAARLEYEMTCRGSIGTAFPTIVAVGSRAAQPHAIPGKCRLRQNQSILFDWGARVNGYRSDLTRCFVTGRIRPVFADVYKWVLEAQMAAIAEVREGNLLSQVDRAAREVLDRSPFPVYGHGTGHGLGLFIHEEPKLYPQTQGTLQENMVITIEPGVYLPGRFGIRIEDDVLVTKKGPKVLSSLAKDLNSVKL